MYLAKSAFLSTWALKRTDDPPRWATIFHPTLHYMYLTRSACLSTWAWERADLVLWISPSFSSTICLHFSSSSSTPAWQKFKSKWGWRHKRRKTLMYDFHVMIQFSIIEWGLPTGIIVYRWRDQYSAALVGLGQHLGNHIALTTISKATGWLSHMKIGLGYYRIQGNWVSRGLK